MYEPPYGPYGAHEMKASYQKNLSYGMLSIAIPFSIFLMVWMLLHPEPETVTIKIDQGDSMAMQATIEALRSAKGGTPTPGSATPGGVFDAKKLKILAENSPSGDSTLIVTVTPVRAEVTDMAPGDGGRFAGIGSYLDRLLKVDEQPVLAKKPDLTPKPDYGLDVRGIGLGTVRIPGDTIKGRLNFSLLELAARRIELKPADTMKVEAELAIDAQGKLKYFHHTYEHPKGAAQIVENALRTVTHRPSKIGDVYCPSAVKMKFFICVDCESGSDAYFELAVLPPE